MSMLLMAQKVQLKKQNYTWKIMVIIMSNFRLLMRLRYNIITSFLIA